MCLWNEQIHEFHQIGEETMKWSQNNWFFERATYTWNLMVVMATCKIMDCRKNEGIPATESFSPLNIQGVSTEYRTASIPSQRTSKTHNASAQAHAHWPHGLGQWISHN